MHDGLKAFSTNRELLLLAAQDAFSRLDWAQAAIYWDALVDRFHKKPALALIAGSILHRPGAGLKERLPGVLARLRAIHASYPNFVPAVTAYQQVLRQAERLEAAAEFRKRWPSPKPFPDRPPAICVLHQVDPLDLGRLVDRPKQVPVKPYHDRLVPRPLFGLTEACARHRQLRTPE